AETNNTVYRFSLAAGSLAPARATLLGPIHESSCSCSSFAFRPPPMRQRRDVESALDMDLDSIIESELGGKAGARPYGKARGGRAGHERSSPFALSGCRGAGKGSAPASCRVFVGNLPYSVRWQELKDHMRSVGDVVFCDIMEEPGTALNSK
ncbi:unnamed protein product, partial [Prorocentrum cordatum]